jgi:Protein of unknown function (DUF2934)
MAPAEARFAALRETYNQRFHRLAQEVHHLQSLMSQPAADGRAVEEAKRCVEQAQSAYRESRDLLAWFMLSGEAQTRTMVIGVGPQDHRADLDHKSQVEHVAYQLWEKAGRPSGKAEEHWYHAERLVHG